MRVLWYFFVLLSSRAAALHNSCNTTQSRILSDQECSDLFFEPGEKSTVSERFNLELHGDVLSISSIKTPWSYTFLRISQYYENHDTKPENNKKICAKLTNFEKTSDWFYNCLAVTSSNVSEAFLLEYKSETSTDAFSKKIVFLAPRIGAKLPIFSYIDLTDTSHLILKTQRLPETLNISYYKVEAYKEKHDKPSLQDLQLFSPDQEIVYEFQTYNDEGEYYFNISIISEQCPEDFCTKSTTPKIHIGRKSTRLVIGIVGASFILPFVLFIFHVITRQYKISDDAVQSDEKIVMIFKSSFKKHDEAIACLAKILQKFTKIQVVLDPIDVLKTNEKFCSDLLILASHIIYVAPPLHQSDQSIHFDFNYADKEICSVVFDYCSDKLPDFFNDYKFFKLLEEFDKFIKSFKSDVDVNKIKRDNAYLELQKKTEEARFDDNNLPTIVVTEFEAQENDSLLSPEENV